jgi:sirohydrochlorin ferrochelatase
MVNHFGSASHLSDNLTLLVRAALPSACFLFDNGSLRAESTLSLRRVAAKLAAHLGQPIQAVSLLHSTRVADEELEGIPACLLEPAMTAFFETHPRGEAVLLPLFFGASGALVDYVPERVAALKLKFPEARVKLARWLFDERAEDRRIAAMLADEVRLTARAKGWAQPKVVLVDHGSPVPTVTRVRNLLGEQLRAALGNEIAVLVVASMERREGEAYAFNEPLLATVLRRPPLDTGEVIVALQFLSPGRHAGPGGDIAEICAAAEKEQPTLCTQMTEPIAGDDRLVALLAERWAEVTAG